MHSATKFLGGHGVAIGGVIVDAGKFDWEASGKFPTLTEPYLGYHGIDFAEEFGPAAFIARARAEGLRDFGACMSPTNAFHILQGVESLPVRMARHVENARKIVAFLDGHDAVSWVSYPELPVAPRPRAREDLCCRQGSGAIFCFGVKGGREAGRAFIEAVELLSHLANVGRRQEPRDPSRQHHPSADGRLCAGGCRGGRGHGAALHRSGRPGRPDRRSRTRAPGGSAGREGPLAVDIRIDGATGLRRHRRPGVRSRACR